MERCWLSLLIGVLLRPVSAAPPAPVNARVISTNFEYVLCWEPAPGTAPETFYIISQRVRGEQNIERQYTSSDTCSKVMLARKMYILHVQASYNSTLSRRSNNVHFDPVTQTKIGAPLISLNGCGNCIKINISVPQADKDSHISDIQKLYKASFKVRWRKKRDTRFLDVSTTDRSYTLKNLDKGVEYCVQVQMITSLNSNTESSAWQCTFTSPQPDAIGPPIYSLIAGLCAVTILLAIAAFCLSYAGIFCKPKAALPSVLTTAPHEGHTLTLERPILDQITLRSEMSDVRKWNNPTSPPAAATDYSAELEDENEDEDDGMNVYMDRDPGLSSGHQASPDVFGAEQPPASGDSGSLAEPEELQEEVDGDETTPESPGVSLTNERGPPGIQDQATDDKDSSSVSSHVDLFSVTLASLAVEREDEEEEEKDCDIFRENGLNLVFSTDLRQTLSDSQTNTSSGSLVHRLCENFTATEYDNDEENSLIQSEEEEEAFSGYLGHK